MSVDLRIDNGRADVVIRRPEVLNAMDWDVFDGLADAFRNVAADSTVRVVVVAGEGGSFSSGIDTNTFGTVQDDPPRMIERAQAPFRALLDIPVPTVACVRGHALGAGFQLALACDLRVVAIDARMGLLEAKYALVPDLGGTRTLTSLAGTGRAKKMIWLAEQIDGAEAERLGIAEIAVPPEALTDAVDDLASRLASASPVAVREAKRLVNGALSLDLADHMDEEAESQQRVFASADFPEAVAAFVEKRQPRYANPG